MTLLSALQNSNLRFDLNSIFSLSNDQNDNLLHYLLYSYLQRFTTL